MIYIPVEPGGNVYESPEKAIIRNSPILILDDPTASLGIETEACVIEALGRAMNNRTVILISHRFSSVSAASKIIVLEEGMVAEHGNQDQLMALGGVYAALSITQLEKQRAVAEA